MFKRLLVFLAVTVLAFGSVATAATKKAKAEAKSNVVKAKSASKNKVGKKTLAKVNRDVNQLETLLIGMTREAKISERSWKSLSNEANSLANRIFAQVKSADAEKPVLRTATQLRDRVGRLHKEAHRGDARDARRYAREALRYAYRLDEWAG